ncbi:MAG: hypothetical protein NVSMB1_18680 [Polyangiales bacterium]
MPKGALDIRAARKLGLASSAESVSQQALDKLAAARIFLTRERPLLGVLARSLRAIPSHVITAPLAITADDYLLVAPELLLRTPFPNLCARVAHVVLHAALGGFARRGARPLPRWNHAHDLAIDPLVRAALLESDYQVDDALINVLPAQAFIGPNSPQGGAFAAETIDAMLERALATEPFLASQALPKPEWIDLYLEVPTALEESSEEQPSQARPPEEIDPTRVEGTGAVPLPGSGRGVADVIDHRENDRENRAEESSVEHPQNADDAQPTEQERFDEEERAASAARRRGAEVQWRMRLAQAIAEDQAAGSPTFARLPKWGREWLQATTEPPPNWTAVLQHSVAQLARGKRSFLRPSRRSAAIGWSSDVRLAGRTIVAAGQLAAVLDTSGSIDEKSMRRALGVIAAAAMAEGVEEVRLIQADAVVTDDRILSASDLQRAPIEIQGRGGTRFWPALKRVAREASARGERGAVIYVTDLEGEFGDPDAFRTIDIVWITEGSAQAPFGKTVRMRR